MGSPSSYSVQSDSVYLTNGSLDSTVPGSCTTITVNNSTSFCVRIQRELVKWSGDSPFIVLPLPVLDLNGTRVTNIVNLGQFTEAVEVRGFLMHTVEGTTNESAQDKKLNLQKLCRKTSNGLKLVIGKDSDEQEIYADQDDEHPLAFVKKVEVLDIAKEGYALSDYYSGGATVRREKPKKKVVILCSLGENLLVKS